jgi:hypothetical protein
MPSPKAVNRHRLLKSMLSYDEAQAACVGMYAEAKDYSCIFDVAGGGLKWPKQANFNSRVLKLNRKQRLRYIEIEHLLHIAPNSIILVCWNRSITAI